MKLTTRSIKTTDTKYRSILDGKVVKGWPPGSISQSQATELEGEITLEVDVEALPSDAGCQSSQSQGAQSHRGVRRHRRHCPRHFVHAG
jgi:hypothetical protein